MKKTLSLVLAILMILTVFPFASFAVEKPAISMTPLLTDAVYDYLNEVYIERFPELGLEFSFGSEADRDVLQKLADTLTKNCKTDKEKAEAVVGWADRNVKYKSYTDGTYYFPIDVFYYRTGNCLGLGLFISQVLRLAGVPAVFCAGSRGDMRDFIDLGNREVDHGWVMIYYDDMWNLYDPLFDVFGTTDRDFISRWYFTDFIEGVSPYYEGMDTEKMLYGRAIFYVDGRFIHYAGGMPASEYFGTAAEGGLGLNGCVPYFTKNRYAAPGGGGDGFQYLENPGRRDSMINDECYSDGWIGYGGMPWSYVRKNGIMAGSTVMELNGEMLYLPYNSSPMRLDGDASAYTFTCGRPTYILGESISLPEPLWLESEKADGKVVTYESLTPEVISVTIDGEFTVHGAGEATILVASRDSYDDPGCYCSGFIEIYIAEEERVYDFSDNIFNVDENESKEIKPLGDSGIAAKSETSVKAFLTDVQGAVLKDVNGQDVREDAKLASGMTVSMPDGTEYTVVVKGDLDSDGTVSSSDARLTLRASVGLESNSSEWFTDAGNVEADKDGKNLTASDARLILRASVGLESQDAWFDAIN